MDKPAKKLAELTQHAFPFRTHRMELFEDRIELTVRAPLERFRVPFYLHVLKEEPDMVLWVPWKTVMLSVLAMITGVLLAVLGGRPADPAAGAVLAAAGAVVLLTSLPMVAGLHVIFYKTLPGRDSIQVRYEPQLFIYPGKPSREEVRRFEELLKIQREKQVEKVRIEQEEMIPYARELERFANLKRENLVTEDEYAQVKAKLLSLKPRRIGF